MHGPNASERPDVLQAKTALLQVVFGYAGSQVLNVAVRLGVADLMDGGSKTSEELASATGTHPPSLHRLLRALTCLGVLEETKAGRFELTALGALLRTDSPNSVSAMAATFCDEGIWRAWGNLAHSVRTGETAFEHVFGVHSYEYIARNPELAAAFHEAMAEATRNAAPSIAASYDFSPYETVVDVGGGDGTLIAAILEANTHMRGILFDTAPGVEAAPAKLEAAGVADRCRISAGDFFESVPIGDVYLLKTVVHNWDDEHSTRILSNCRGVMAEGGKLLLVEAVLPERIESTEAIGDVLNDLNGLVLDGGRERTEEEFRGLLAASGFETGSITPPLGPTSYRLIEGTPV